MDETRYHTLQPWPLVVALEDVHGPERAELVIEAIRGAGEDGARVTIKCWAFQAGLLLEWQVN